MLSLLTQVLYCSEIEITFSWVTLVESWSIKRKESVRKKLSYPSLVWDTRINFIQNIQDGFSQTRNDAKVMIDSADREKKINIPLALSRGTNI